MANNTVQSEFLISGTWTDYSSRVRTASPGRGVEISRGLADQQSGLTATSSDFTLNNRDGLFSNKNPLSALYGLLPPNTQVRQSIYPAGGSREGVLKTFHPTGSGIIMSTADKASLDVTGDMELRFEVTPHSWRPMRYSTIASKWVTSGGQRSWWVGIAPTGAIFFRWSPDGVNFASTGAFSSVVNEGQGRVCVRVRLDVDNGAGGWTVTFDLATDLSFSGTVTSLGSTTTAAGITSVFSGTANLEIGCGNGGTGVFSNAETYTGKNHGFRLYSGFGTTLVANMDPTVRAPGTTTWSDGLAAPNTWTIGANPYTRITSDQIRFAGELTALPTEWDETRKDVWVNTRALSALARLVTAGKQALSPMRRLFGGWSNIVGYWPMEARSGATVPDSAASGNIVSVMNNCTFSGSAPSGLAGSAGAITFTGSDSYIKLTRYGASGTGVAGFAFCFRLNGTLPASNKSFYVGRMFGGTLNSVELTVGVGGWNFNVYDNGGGTAFTTGVGFGTGVAPQSGFVTMLIFMAQEGANVRITTSWNAAGSSTFYTHAVGGSTFVGTVGTPYEILNAATQDAAFVGAQGCHYIMTTSFNNAGTNGANFGQICTGFPNERAARRLMRLAPEAGYAIDIIGDPDETPLMSVQAPGSLIDLMQECSAVDGGPLADARDRAGFVYVTACALGDRSGIQFAYTTSVMRSTPKPTDDNRYLANQVTVSNSGGSSSTASLTTGPKSILDPPNGVSLVSIGVTRNVPDTGLDKQANWEVFWRTWNEYRYPQINFHMNRSVMSTANTLTYKRLWGLDVGDSITLTSLPSFVSYDDALNSAFGYNETLDQMQWVITFNTVPRGPYRTKPLASGFDTLNPAMDSATSQSLLNVAVNTTATSMDVKVVGGVASGRRWWTGASGSDPILAQIGGEEISITAVTAGAASGADWVQTLTVTRSVNGVVKAQTLNTEIKLYIPAYIGLGV